MLARVFQWGVQYIEHSGNPLGDLSMPRGSKTEVVDRRLLYFI